MIEVQPKVLRQIHAALPEISLGYAFENAVISEMAKLSYDSVNVSPIQLHDIGTRIAQTVIHNSSDKNMNELTDEQNVGFTEEKYDRISDVVREIKRARNALSQCIDELTIFPEAKLFIQERVDKGTFDLTYPGIFHYTLVTNIDSINVNLNVEELIRFAIFAKTIFRQEISKEQVTAEIVSLVGHELGGHGINRILGIRAGWRVVTPSVKLGDFAMDDFPYIFQGDAPDEIQLNREIYDWAKEERFADYFEIALLRGMGYRETILQDKVRLFFAHPLETRLTFKQLRLIIDGMKTELLIGNESISAIERERREKIIGSLLFDLYKNSGFPMMFPFSREVVETIINQAWRSL